MSRGVDQNRGGGYWQPNQPSAVLAQCPLLPVQTVRHTDRHTDRETDRDTDRQRDRQTDRQTHRQTERQTDRHTDTQTHRQTDTQTDTQTDKHNTHSNREREEIPNQGHHWDQEKCVLRPYLCVLFHRIKCVLH